MAKVAWQWQAIRLTRCSEQEEGTRACGRNAVGEALKDGKRGRTGLDWLGRKGAFSASCSCSDSIVTFAGTRTRSFRRAPCKICSLSSDMRGRALAKLMVSFFPLISGEASSFSVNFAYKQPSGAKIVRHYKLVRTGNGEPSK